eukprot:6207090-Pleurochrysis_carterae.AAC.2
MVVAGVGLETRCGRRSRQDSARRLQRTFAREAQPSVANGSAGARFAWTRSAGPRSAGWLHSVVRRGGARTHAAGPNVAGSPTTFSCCAVSRAPACIACMSSAARTR